MYQILAKSSNPWRSYCDFSIWLNDLKYATCCAML